MEFRNRWMAGEARVEKNLAFPAVRQRAERNLLLLAYCLTRIWNAFATSGNETKLDHSPGRVPVKADLLRPILGCLKRPCATIVRESRGISDYAMCPYAIFGAT
jgi:hypothetical protein